MTKLTKNQKNQLWSLILLADFDFSRVKIAEHELNDEHLTLWLVDKLDREETECVILEIPAKDFAISITENKLNTYEGSICTPKGRVVSADIMIDSAIAWYNNDASAYEQNYARETMLREIILSLKSGEVAA